MADLNALSEAGLKFTAGVRHRECVEMRRMVRAEQLAIIGFGSKFIYKIQGEMGMATEDWKFEHNLALSLFGRGLREIFEYRDLGAKSATNGDYIALIIRSKGSPDHDEVQHWHVHHCDFQFVMVLEVGGV